MLRRVACAALVVGALGSGSSPAGAEEQRCKGTKQLYAGKCLYPDEIARLQEQERQRRAAAEAARHKAEAERAERAKKEADVVACDQAKKADGAADWQKYLAEHPDGSCVEQARARLTAIEAASQPAAAPTASASATDEAAPPEAEEGSSEISPLVWVGVALAGAGAITWGVAGGLLVGKSSELETSCPDQRCPDDRQEDLDSAKLTAHVSTVGVVVTGVGVAIGVVGLLWPLFESGDEPAMDATTETVSAEPWLGPGFAGVQGKF